MRTILRELRDHGASPEEISRAAAQAEEDTADWTMWDRISGAASDALHDEPALWLVTPEEVRARLLAVTAADVHAALRLLDPTLLVTLPAAAYDGDPLLAEGHLASMDAPEGSAAPEELQGEEFPAKLSTRLRGMTLSAVVGEEGVMVRMSSSRLCTRWEDVVAWQVEDGGGRAYVLHEADGGALQVPVSLLVRQERLAAALEAHLPERLRIPDSTAFE